eukprot:m.9613 g.9613  ORF g.9613 m.9613 type:complete len:88 (+) comp2993_c0_seq1:637-900(+)
MDDGAANSLPLYHQTLRDDVDRDSNTLRVESQSAWLELSDVAATSMPHTRAATCEMNEAAAPATKLRTGSMSETTRMWCRSASYEVM